MKVPFTIEFKQRIYDACLKILENKSLILNAALDSLTDELKNDTKSSMGDKHETSRSMNQLEQEKISNQITELNKQISSLQQINIHFKNPIIVNGSLIKSDKGLVFIAVGLGKIEIDDHEVIVISAQSPLGKLFLGKGLHDKVSVGANNYTVLELI